MPPAKPTSANDHRPLHVDLRAKVIGTNVLLDRLTQEVTRLVEAQREMTAKLGLLLTQPMVRVEPPVRATAAMQPVFNMPPTGHTVPHGTGAALMESFRQTAVEIDQQRSAYTDYIEDESPPPSSLAAQMAQELAEEAAWDAEEPEPAPPPPPDNHALWQRRLSSWRGSRLWMPEWGPRPGQEGCKAPASMLNGRR